MSNRGNLDPASAPPFPVLAGTRSCLQAQSWEVAQEEHSPWHLQAQAIFPSVTGIGSMGGKLFLVAKLKAPLGKPTFTPSRGQPVCLTPSGRCFLELLAPFVPRSVPETERSLKPLPIRNVALNL